jgi:hypothetical protein
MPFIGNKPAQVPLTSADIADSIITSAKIVDGTIVNSDISTTSAITLNKLSGNPNFRNIVINGDMQIAQRSTSVASITGDGYYTLDRFSLALSSLGTWTMSQSTDVPSGYGFANSLKLDCTTADASPSASDAMYLQTVFEGQNLQYLKKGTANALPLTLSFWVKSTKTGTFIVELFDSNNTRQISKSYTANTTNTWEFKTITFSGDTTGAFTNNNGASLYLVFWLGAGSNFTSGTLNTSWASNTNANRAVGQVNCADSTSNDFLITGVQLEAGTSATDFEFLPYDVDLARCQRYFKKLQTYSFDGYAGASGQFMYILFQLDPPMRASPTVTAGSNGGGTSNASAISAIESSTIGFSYRITSSAGGRFYSLTNTGATADAEL